MKFIMKYRFEKGSLSNLGQEYTVFTDQNETWVYSGKIFVKKKNPSYVYLKSIYEVMDITNNLGDEI